jgi:hypothetical protein
MTKSDNIILTTIAALIAVLASFIVLTTPTITHASDNKSTTESKTAVKKEEKKSDDKAFKYTAQPGDSYSQFARKAVQTYGINNNVKLSKAQIIFAETTLTQAAGSPVLNLGEVKVIAYDSVKDVVEKATKLTDAQKKAWEAYTVGVNFNTDKVGEARK